MNPVDNALRAEDLAVLAAKFPSLKRMEVPERYYKTFRDVRDVRDVVDFEKLQTDLVLRWPSEPASQVGIFLGHSAREEELFWINNTSGIRSSMKV